ncbi:hypothetical protein [Pyrobaculum neutrophilum]|uniref:Uncharacterized protein n=1 Tax=Pyrobaculum neutrophilum (strain DSM 2338 / JCM 9278 / NBRC 100436 / V24Sta) TaxID=444157 RepID=B1Y9R4_PYRNV|nr:hypothetical protein [Pyrobaculum neutrophilum]ACB38986.1 hypothetical protein Tneu_0028 [Pyrobaculum neutrophilum V24Sta]
MLYYGRPEDLARAVRREIELLGALLNIDERLDAFIKRKIELLNRCLSQVERLPQGEYQLIAVGGCEIVPI